MEAIRDSMGEAEFLLRFEDSSGLGCGDVGVRHSEQSFLLSNSQLHFPLVTSVFPTNPPFPSDPLSASTNIASAWSYLAPSRSRVGHIPPHLYPPLSIGSFSVIVGKVY